MSLSLVSLQGLFLRLAQRTQYTLRRKRHFHNTHFDCVIKRISDRRRNAEHAGLAYSLRAEWPVLVRDFHEFAGEIVRQVEHTRDLIISEAGIHDLPVAENHLLEDGEAELHYACADKLALYNIRDRKSTRLNSSHSSISYAVFCLK